MKDQIDQVRRKMTEFVIDSSLSLEAFRIQFLVSKGVMKELYAHLKLVPNDEKRMIGLLLNDLRAEVEAKIELEKQNFLQLGVNDKSSDLSKSGEDAAIGSHHPLTLVKREIISIFSRIGYTVSEGPEIEDDWHNFSVFISVAVAVVTGTGFEIITTPIIIYVTNFNSVHFGHLAFEVV